MQYFDVPNLHSNNQVGKQFIKALIEQPEIEIYSCYVVQNIINYHWRFVRWQMYGIYLIPFILQLVSFSIWSNLVLNDIKLQFSSIDTTAVIFIVCLSLYLIALEIRELVKNGIKYFYGTENYIELPV